MSNPSRTQIGAEVHVLATDLTSKPECARLFGTNYKTKKVNGVVVQCNTRRHESGSRAQTIITVKCTLESGSYTREIVKELALSRVKLGHVPITQDSDVNEFVSNDITWTVSDVSECIGGSVSHQPWTLKMNDGLFIIEDGGIGDRSLRELFLGIFPFEHLVQMVQWTSDELSRLGLRSTSQSELLRFFGILILATRIDFNHRHELWSTTSDCNYIAPARFGATGMSRNRFDNILRCCRFSHVPSDRGALSSSEYRWKHVDGFVNSINSHRAQKFTPSECICVDESMSKWDGLGGHWINTGLPHYVSLDRKPESGCEIQNAACGRSGIMIGLEIVKSKADTAEKLYEDLMNHGPAVIRRLTAPWAGTNRIVCADSYFSSVATAEELSKVNLRFIGVVKTATKGFPMQFLSQTEAGERFSHKSLVRLDENGRVQMGALMWIDQSRRYLVFTASSTEQSDPYTRLRWRAMDNGDVEQVSVEVRQPKVVQLYYSVASQIDKHNRCRQADLAIERKIGTKSWAFRVNSSILGMMVVDCWLLYHAASGSRSHINQNTFYKKLAESLIDGGEEERLQPPMSSRRILNGAGTFLERTAKRRKRKDGTVTRFSLQRNCTVCKKKTTMICSECKCSDNTEVFFCHPDRNRPCFSLHLQEKHHHHE